MRYLFLLLVTLLSGCSSFEIKEEKLVQDVEKVVSDSAVTLTDAKQVVKDFKEL